MKGDLGSTIDIPWFPLILCAIFLLVDYSVGADLWIRWRKPNSYWAWRIGGGFGAMVLGTIWL